MNIQRHSHEIPKVSRVREVMTFFSLLVFKCVSIILFFIFCYTNNFDLMTYLQINVTSKGNKLLK